MIPLAFSTNAFKKNTLEESIASIAAIGYRSVEIMADVPHADPQAFSSPQRAALKQQLKALGLTVSNVNAFTFFACGDTYHPTWIEDDAGKREQRIRHTLAAVELAAEIGAKTVSLQPGGPMIGTSITPKIAAERYAEGLSRVVPLARERNVVLAIEPEPGLFIQDSAEYLQFKNAFFKNEGHVLMNCDVGHLFCVGEDPAEVIRRLAPHIAHVHIEDIGKNRVHQHLTPGKGVLDLAAVFSALEDIQYSRPATVELYPYETSAAGVAKMAFEHLRF